MLYTHALLVLECSIEFALFVLPGNHLHKVRHKRWYGTLENCRIAAYDIFIVNLRLVELLHNWRGG